MVISLGLSNFKVLITDLHMKYIFSYQYWWMLLDKHCILYLWFFHGICTVVAIHLSSILKHCLAVLLLLITSSSLSVIKLHIGNIENLWENYCIKDAITLCGHIYSTHFTLLNDAYCTSLITPHKLFQTPNYSLEGVHYSESWLHLSN